MAGIGPMLAAQFINAAAFLGLVVIAWRLAQSFVVPMGSKVSAMCAVISAPVLTWVFGGLEPVLVAALVAGAYVLAFRVLQGNDSLPLSLAASGLFAAAYLARPDALIGNFAMGGGPAGICKFARLQTDCSLCRNRQRISTDPMRAYCCATRNLRRTPPPYVLRQSRRFYSHAFDAWVEIFAREPASTAQFILASCRRTYAAFN